MDTEIIKIILAFMVLINPFSALTLFLDLTRGYSMKNRRKVARIACLTIFITISFFIQNFSVVEVYQHTR